MNPDLQDACADLAALTPRLRHNLTQNPPAVTDEHGRHQKAPAAPIPWNEPAANIYLDIHAAVREARATLRTDLGLPPRPHGTTDAATQRALEWIANSHSNATPATLKDLAHTLHQLGIRARAHLDEPRPGETPWTKAPANLACPYCNRPLLLAPGWEYDNNPPLHCRSCPQLPADETGPHLEWQANTWLAIIQNH